MGSLVSEALLESKLFKKENKVYVDSKAVKSRAARLGMSKRIRHVRPHFLYLQNLVAASIIQIYNVPGVKKSADVFAKYVSTDVNAIPLPLDCIALLASATLPRCANV